MSGTGDVLSGSQSEGVAHMGVLQEWFGERWWNARAVALLFTAVFIMLPLVLLRRVGERYSIPGIYVHMLSIHLNVACGALLW